MANKTGQDVYDSLTDVAVGYAEATAAAYASAASTKGVAAANDAARAAAGAAYTKFITMAGGLGLNDSQARKLADSLGIVEGAKPTDVPRPEIIAVLTWARPKTNWTHSTKKRSTTRRPMSR